MTVLGPSGHHDTFSRDNLPPQDAWPEFAMDGFDYPDHINVGVELTDKMVENGFGDHTALIGNGRRRTYKELSDWTNRLAHVLVDNLGIKPGNRVLIRSANNPAMVACWLAATKAGAVVVNSMPMLRSGELAAIVDKAEISHALCDTRLMDELIDCAKNSDHLTSVVGFDGTSNHDAELDRLALEKPVQFDAVKTGRDDVALLGFTSGTTGKPKATMHFHRDLLMIADGYAKEVLGVTSDDIFIGSPPLAFTFGLGGLAIFPLRFGAAATLLENASPPNLVEIIEKYRATVCFTAPTAYRVMLQAMDDGADLSSLRAAVSAGETLPAPIYDQWMEKTGKPMLDGIGATEMLHIFISNRFDDHKAACTGKPVTGYEVKIIDADGAEVPVGAQENDILDNPGAVAVNRRALSNAGDEMSDAERPDHQGTGIARVFDLNYDGLSNKRFPTSRVLVLTKLKASRIRLASELMPEGEKLKTTPALPKDEVRALGVAEVYFKRPPSAPARQEYASLYNPFWQVRLASPTIAEKEVAANAR